MLGKNVPLKNVLKPHKQLYTCAVTEKNRHVTADRETSTSIAESFRPLPFVLQRQPPPLNCSRCRGVERLLAKEPEQRRNPGVSQAGASAPSCGIHPLALDRSQDLGALVRRRRRRDAPLINIICVSGRNACSSTRCYTYSSVCCGMYLFIYFPYVLILRNEKADKRTCSGHRLQ